MPHTKQHLRSLYLQKRASLNWEQALRASHFIAEKILSFPAPAPNHSVAGYFPIRHEVDILPTLAQLHAKGHKTALPIIRHIHTPLEFHCWKPGDTLVNSSLFKAVFEPSPSSPIVIPDVILVPLLAFDRKGYRLGYGSGAYDRTLAHYRENGRTPITIGVAYSIQEADDLPHISFDQKVDYIITEREIIDCQG